MSAASDLFETLKGFGTSPMAGKTPQESLIDYCQTVLGGVERVHFDFKSKASPSKDALDDSDKKNLAKAVSGFANGAGGVLVWGIEDKSIAPKPICRVSQFIDALLQIGHQVADPTVPGLDGDFVPADSNSDNGFGILFIPESDLPPHRVVLKIKEIQNHYYIRSGSSFSVATHSQLEDMFGRRPRPRLRVRFVFERMVSDTEVWYGVILENEGRGIARYPFLALEVDKPYGLSPFGADGNGKFGLPLIEKSKGFRWGYSNAVYGSMSFGSQEGFAIHSGMRHLITKMIWNPKERSETRDLSVRYRTAAEGLPLEEVKQILTEAELVSSTQE